MIRLLAIVAITTLAACSGGTSGDASAADPVVRVTLGTAQQGNVAETVTLYGAVETGAEAQYTLAAPAEARVASIAAPVGTPVRRGQLVVGLSPSPATRAQFASAQNDYQAAQNALARARRLRADGLASDAEVETARQAAQNSAAMQQSMASQTGELALRAPGPGYVQSVAVNPGDLVSAGTTIATIARVGTLRARFGVDPAVVRKLSAGTVLRLNASEGGTPFDAPILSVDPTVDPQSQLASVYVRVPAGQALGPGQPLTAIVPVRQEGNAVTVPYAALLDDGGQPFVFIVKSGTAHRHDVVTGASNGARIAIAKGVSSGDTVVIEGGTAVEDGMKVSTK